MALRRIARLYLESLRTHADDLKIQFQALAESDDPEIARQLRENHKAYVRFFARLIERGQREGVVRRDLDPYSAGWVLNGVGFTLTLVRLLDFDQGLGRRRMESMMEGCLDWLAESRRRPPPSRSQSIAGAAAEACRAGVKRATVLKSKAARTRRS